jgi:hypothetical protein
MAHEQLPWLAPFSQQVAPGFSWRTSRHELAPTLMALQHLYVHEPERLVQILELIENDISSQRSKKHGAPGLSCWENLVLASLRLGCNLDYDQLSDYATDHRKIQQMMGISNWDVKYYSRSTIHENIRCLSPKTIRAITDIIIEVGHHLFAGDPLKMVRGDTFVLKKNIHYPTDTNLLYDGIRKTIEISFAIAQQYDLSGWRQHEYLTRKAKRTMRKISKVARSRQPDRDTQLKGLYLDMMEQADKIVDKSLETIALLNLKLKDENRSLSPHWQKEVNDLYQFIAGTEYVCELAQRRIIEGETIPNPDKVFSLFEPDTELINRGKTPTPIEFGHRVLIVQDYAGFIICSMKLGNGFTDEKVITQVMKKLQDRYHGKIRAASFDKGFWTPHNLMDLSEFIPLVVLPKKGKRSESDRLREGSKEFGKVRKWHSGVESAIHALGAGNGMTVCRDKGYDGYERYIAMAVLGRNLQTLGSILIVKERERRKKDLLLAFVA